MQSEQIKTHQDGIWVSESKEIAIIQQFSEVILNNNFMPTRQNSNNFGYPYMYKKDNVKLHCRFVDSVFLEDPDASNGVIVTDNIPLQPVEGELISAVPEFWHIWQFDPVYQSRPAIWAYNCFMNRARGDRSRVFYELQRRKLLSNGLVSYNVNPNEYNQQFVESSLEKYTVEHDQLGSLIPYNTLTGTLEQCIIDSRVSLILETYTSDSHIVFSEKVFRCLQMPRPWLLYCSTGAISQLRHFGFDLLDDYVDHSYDHTVQHAHRLTAILDQLETFVDREYTAQDYIRFEQATAHNKELLQKFTQEWPARANAILNRIKEL
jgi:hypothetical protein